MREPISLREEALTQSMEAQLETLGEYDDPFPALAPLLDALDREASCPAFDAAEGWAKLERQRPKRKRRLPKAVLAAAVVLLCVALCGAALALVLHNKFADYFHAAPDQTALLTPLAEEPEARFTKDGVTVNVLQTITDTMGIYVLYEITVPETVTLPENTTSVAIDALIPEFPPKDKDRLGGRGGSEILELGPHRVLAMSYLVENNMAPMDLSMNLCFLPSLSLQTADGETFVLLDEPVTLTWPVKPNNVVRTWQPELLLGAGVLAKVLVSPISLVVLVDGAPLEEAVTLYFSDGSALTLDQHTKETRQGAVLLDKTTGQMRYQLYETFENPIDVAAIETIVIGAVKLD